MKKLIFILIAIFTIIACDRTENNENKVSGEWKLQSAKYIATNQTIDYSNKNIIYNFQNNGTLNVYGGSNEGYNDGNYSYIFKNDYLSNYPTNNEQKIDLVIIQNSKWAFSNSNNQMTLDQTHVDGPKLTFIKK